MKAPLFYLAGDAKILNQIRKGDENALLSLLESNRRPVMSLISKNNGSRDDAEDILQESVIVLWERVRAGRFEYKAKLSTFIYGTAKNLWYGRLRGRVREIAGEIDPDDHRDPSPSALDELMASEESKMVGEALRKIGEQCRRLLLLFYYEECSMDEIAVKLGFANADTAKAKKYQCKKALEKVLSALAEK